MNKFIVGLGEALWDVLPKERKSAAHLPISHTMSHSSDLKALQ